jgi:hypothetical protein
VTIQLPDELREALSWLGFDWPDSDEDKLNEMGNAWEQFATTLKGIVDEADRSAQAVWSTNRGDAIDAFQKSWNGPSAPMTNLREAAEGAALIAVGLHTAAEIVLVLKGKFILEVAAFARTLYVAAMAAKTPWSAAAAAAAVIIHKIIVTQAINAAIEFAMKRLLDG